MDDATVARADTPSPATGLRFSPGTMLAGRYRIVALLGRGGMGEVYRADDTKLGHPVALKFLPRYVFQDAAALDRLYGEVRLGRQVAHPNVCKLYDIGESDEGHFIAMEYVDGEDLASLLRRIGRLPAAKAIDIARDLSAGLAAAHDVGIVHRDLKPANVMVDGRGRARITDFGLAAVAGDEAAGFAGTPAYMSPEQLSGGTVTPRSDIYALGLVLYEMFTGRRLFDGTTVNEIQSQHRTRPPSISSVVREIDPAVERVVMRCLEEDPAARPSSAHAIIAALPGGDPLAAALAAGETPSPEMVAAAGKVGDLQPRVAWLLMLAALAGIVAIAAMTQRAMLFSSKLLPKSSEVLDARGADILEHFGYSLPVASTAHEWTVNDDYMDYMEKRKNGIDRWDAIAKARPGILLFTLRQHTRVMDPWNEERRIQSTDPPLTEPGMTQVVVDASGRLVRFLAVPLLRDPSPAQPVDWSAGFREAALDPANFHDARPVWSSPVDVDLRRAWDGVIPEQKDIPLHVEAGAHRGKLVWFDVYGPWDQAGSLIESPRPFGQRLSDAVNMLLGVGLLPVALFVAIRNARRGRGDRKGAFRVAAFVLIAASIAVFLRADILDSFARDTGRMVEVILGRALYDAAFVWVMYMAIEPYVRRHWPHTLTAWSRLLAGRFRDPMVGRDVLVGALGGVFLVTLLRLTRVVPLWFGLAPPQPIVSATSPFASPRHVLFFILITIGQYLGAALALVVAMVIIRAVVKNSIVATSIITLILCAAFGGVQNASAWILVPFCLLSAATLVTVMLRFGLLSLAVTGYLFQALQVLPLTVDPSAWYFGRSMLGMLLITVLVIYGFMVSLGGKPLFGTALLEE